MHVLLTPTYTKDGSVRETETTAGFQTQRDFIQAIRCLQAKPRAEANVKQHLEPSLHTGSCSPESRSSAATWVRTNSGKPARTRAAEHSCRDSWPVGEPASYCKICPGLGLAPSPVPEGGGICLPPLPTAPEHSSRSPSLWLTGMGLGEGRCHVPGLHLHSTCPLSSENADLPRFLHFFVPVGRYLVLSSYLFVRSRVTGLISSLR